MPSRKFQKMLNRHKYKRALTVFKQNPYDKQVVKWKKLEKKMSELQADGDWDALFCIFWNIPIEWKNEKQQLFNEWVQLLKKDENDKHMKRLLGMARGLDVSMAQK